MSDPKCICIEWPRDDCPVFGHGVDKRPLHKRLREALRGYEDDHLRITAPCTCDACHEVYKDTGLCTCVASRTKDWAGTNGWSK